MHSDSRKVRGRKSRDADKKERYRGRNKKTRQEEMTTGLAARKNWRKEENSPDLAKRPTEV